MLYILNIDYYLKIFTDDKVNGLLAINLQKKNYILN